MPPILRLRFEVEEFLASCEQDLGCASGTTTFYWKKLASLVAWAEAKHTQGRDAQALCEFLRLLKATGLSETTRHGNYPRDSCILEFPGTTQDRQALAADADIRIRQRWKRPELPNAEKLHRLLTVDESGCVPARSEGARPIS